MTFITTSQEKDGLLLNDTIVGDYIVFAAGVTWSQKGNTYALAMGAGGQTLSLAGSIYSAGAGVFMTSNETVTVAATGVIAAEDFALYADNNGQTATIFNHGLIQAGIAAIAIGSATNVFLQNDGTIASQAKAVALGGATDTISNGGSVIGAIETGAGSDRLTNTGTIQGAITFASAFGELPTLVNSGTIAGTVTGGAGSETITNAGEILGDLLTGAGADRIVNSGQITGSIVTSGILGSARVNVLNTGHITGGITTGAATDTIDTHLGTIGGALAGGNGSDTYVIAGTETINETTATNGGIDTVLSYGDYRLASGLENLSLFGNAHLGVGNALDNYLTASFVGATLLGGNGNDVLTGEDGDDTLRGGGGADTFYEVDGQNQIFGGAGDDKVYLASGDNAVSGGQGNDIFVAGDGIDYLSGDAGLDTVSYANSGSGVTVSLDAGTTAGGYAEGDQLYGIENLVGSASTDILTGSVAGNRLDGGAANDTLAGGEGDDVLTGGAGADLVDGGIGFDIADYSTATTAIVLNGAALSGDIVGDAFNSIEGFRLSQFDDTFVAVYDLSLTLYGGSGNDTIVARGAGDRLDGDTGNDTLTGGGGADVFQFDRFFNLSTTIGWGKDTITDFQDATDKIDLSHAFGIDDFADLTITRGRLGTTIAFGSDTILLSNVASANITADDFIFG